VKSYYSLALKLVEKVLDYQSEIARFENKREVNKFSSMEFEMPARYN